MRKHRNWLTISALLLLSAGWNVANAQVGALEYSLLPKILGQEDGGLTVYLQLTNLTIANLNLAPFHCRIQYCAAVGTPTDQETLLNIYPQWNNVHLKTIAGVGGHLCLGT
jgi:hypothetical protein